VFDRKRRRIDNEAGAPSPYGLSGSWGWGTDEDVADRSIVDSAES